MVAARHFAMSEYRHQCRIVRQTHSDCPSTATGHDELCQYFLNEISDSRRGGIIRRPGIDCFMCTNIIVKHYPTALPVVRFAGGAIFRPHMCIAANCTVYQNERKIGGLTLYNNPHHIKNCYVRSPLNECKGRIRRNCGGLAWRWEEVNAYHQLPAYGRGGWLWYNTK